MGQQASVGGGPSRSALWFKAEAARRPLERVTTAAP
jgi:hypothetical protein